ncbi:MAG: InlB B-repeat-containing protein [Eubacterium sp.]|nr:InlB B-repeat-containing protein [Eubacterium sp.]
MKKLLRKFMSLMISLLLLLSVFGGTTNVFAESNLEGMPDSIKNLVKDNYWAELEYKSQNPIPTYLMTPEESSLSGIAFSTNDGNSLYRNTGIRTDRTGLMDVNGGDYLGDFLIPAYKMMAENPELMKTPDVLQQFNMDLYNAFNLDVKTNMPIENDLYVYGDISVNDNTQNAEVVTLTKGETANLKFSLDTSRMKKALNAILLWNHSANNGGTPQQSWDTPMNSAWKKDYADSDAELVFVMDLPNGVKVDETAEYTIDGLTGFEIKREINGQRVIVHVRKKPGSVGHSLKKIYEKINGLDKVSLNVSKIKITNDVPVDENIKIIGYAYGAYDLSYGTNREVISNRDMTKKAAEDYIYRDYYMMAAKQSDTGRDSTSPAEKSNLISYTFKVKKTIDNTVTFINDNEEYAKVKVETGEAIDNDNFTEESMPQNPSKSGYIFKEWNTQKDGKGARFTGTTVVNENMTVYAIYSKEAAVDNNKPKPDKGKTQVPDAKELPKTGDSSNMLLHVMLIVLSGILLVLINFRKNIIGKKI